MGLIKNLDSEIVAAFISAVVAIIVFLVTELIGWSRNKANISHATKSCRNMMFAWIEGVKPRVESQIKALYVLADNITQSDNIQCEPLQINFNYSERLLTYPIQDISKALLVNSIAKGNICDSKINREFFNLYAQLENLKNFEKEIAEKYKVYQLRSEALRNEWNDIYLNRFLKTYQDFDDQSKYATSPWYRFHNSLRKAIYDFTFKIEHANSEICLSFIKELSSSLDKAVQDSLKVYPNNVYAQRIANTIQSMDIFIKSIEMHHYGFGIVFKSIAKSMQESLNSLMLSKDYFQKETHVADFCQLQ